MRSVRLAMLGLFAGIALASVPRPVGDANRERSGVHHQAGSIQTAGGSGEQGGSPGLGVRLLRVEFRRFELRRPDGWRGWDRGDRQWMVAHEDFPDRLAGFLNSASFAGGASSSGDSAGGAPGGDGESFAFGGMPGNGGSGVLPGAFKAAAASPTSQTGPSSDPGPEPDLPEAPSSNPQFEAPPRGAPISSPTPEPSTWAMLIVGIGAAGAMLRRARRPAPLAVEA